MLRKNYQRKKKNKFLFYSLIIFLTVLSIVIYLDAQLRPIVQNMAKYRVQSKILQISNNTIMEEISENQIDYSDLVKITHNDNSEILMMSYDTTTVNKLKAHLTSKIISNIENIEELYIYVPIANITGIEFLQNRGPRIKFTVFPTASVQTDVESEFENTGINQVVHKIFITLKINANAFVPNYSSNISFENKICIAQTIIVGKVPNNISDKYLRIN